jgi:hypothetical protein
VDLAIRPLVEISGESIVALHPNLHGINEARLPHQFGGHLLPRIFEIICLDRDAVYSSSTFFS